MNIIEKVKNMLESKPLSLPLPRTDEELAVFLAYKKAEKGPKPSATKPQSEKSGNNIIAAIAQAIDPPCTDPLATLRAILAEMHYSTPALSAAVKLRDATMAAETADQKLMDALGRDLSATRFAASKAAGVPEIREAHRQREAGERQAVRVRMHERRKKCAEICRPVLADFRSKAGVWVDAMLAAEREQCTKFKITYQPSPLISGLRLALRAIDNNKVIRDNPEANALVSPRDVLPFI